MTKRCLLLLLSILLLSATAYATDSVPMMDKDGLKGLLGSDDLIVLDARSDGDWSTSTRKITGAIRASSKTYAQWKTDYPREKTIVLYCS